jgi:hypothetical protein
VRLEKVAVTGRFFAGMLEDNLRRTSAEGKEEKGWAV